MKSPPESRSEWQLWIPIISCLVLSATSFYALLFVLSWTAIGFVVLRIKQGRKLTSLGKPEYRHGIRKAALVIYHICWWPAYL